MSVLQAGLALGFGLIISMGPQNLFVIRQGLKKEYAIIAVLACSVCDMILVLLSAFSIGQLIFIYPTLKWLMIGVGALFLVVYGIKSIYSGYQLYQTPGVFELDKLTSSISPFRLLLTAVSFSLLNPQAIVDTMILIGGVVNQYPKEDQVFFVMGVIAASFLWFTGISTLASSCARYLNSRKFWALLEVASGLIMLNFSLALCLKGASL